MLISTEKAAVYAGDNECEIRSHHNSNFIFWEYDTEFCKLPSSFQMQGTCVQVFLSCIICATSAC
jgi:hypothetical protein